jgi:hypothetical protein
MITRYTRQIRSQANPEPVLRLLVVVHTPAGSDHFGGDAVAGVRSLRRQKLVTTAAAQQERESCAVDCPGQALAEAAFFRVKTSDTVDRGQALLANKARQLM